MSDGKISPCLLCDIDGTIAMKGDRSPYDMSKVHLDTPREGMLYLLNSLHSDYYVVYMSGRNERARIDTIEWLKDKGFPRGLSLHMRADGDNRPDWLIKRELYRSRVEPFCHVTLVLDDRDQVVKMWRELGLLTLQVDYGNF